MSVNEAREEIHEAQLKRQRAAFSKWINAQFFRADRLSEATQVNDLEEDLTSGIRLIKLMSVLCPAVPVPRYNQKPKMKIQSCENLNAALEMVKQAKIKFVGIGSDNLFNKDSTLVLGLIWSIIYAIQIGAITIEDDEGGKARSGKDALLLWCQRQTEGYEGVEVKNFTGSWKDGKALAALIHHNRPELLDLEWAVIVDMEPAELMNACFNAAEKLKIPPLIDAEDMLSGDDEKINMTYIAEFFTLFSKEASSNAASRRIKAFVDRQRAIEETIATYETGTKEFLAWGKMMQDKVEANSDMDAITQSLEDSTDRMKRMEKYRKEDCQKFLKSKNMLCAVYQNVMTTSKAHNRKPYTPPEGIPTGPQLAEMWSHMEARGWKYITFLQEYLQAQRKIVEGEYSEGATALDEHIDKMQKALTGMEGDMETQLAAVIELQANAANSELLEKVGELHSRLEDNGVNTDALPGMKHRFTELKWLYDNLLDSINQRKVFLDMELAAGEKKKNEKGLSDKELDDMSKTFKVFDLAHTGALSEIDFERCLKSLGINLPEDELHAMFKKFAVGSGVSFDNFITFMAELTTEEENKQQVMLAFKTLAQASERVTADQLELIGAEAISFLTTHMPTSENGMDYASYLDVVFE